MKVKEGELATGDEAASHADSLGAFPKAFQPPTTQHARTYALRAATLRDGPATNPLIQR